MYKAFTERLHEHKVALASGIRSRRLRWQLQTLEEMLAGRTTTLRVRPVSILRDLQLMHCHVE